MPFGASCGTDSTAGRSRRTRTFALAEAVPGQPCDDHITPEAQRLCARVMHKPELTDDKTLMLALAAAHAALARYFRPGERSAEEALEAIGAVLDHADVEAALQRKMRQEEASAHQGSGTSSRREPTGLPAER